MRTRNVIMITNAFGDKGSHEHDICGWQRQHRPSKRARVEEKITDQTAKKRHAESLLEWVDATSDIKDLRKGNNSAEKMGKNICTGSGHYRPRDDGRDQCGEL